MCLFMTLRFAGADGKGFSPDKKLFEKFREQKEAEIEALKASHEVCQNFFFFFFFFSSQVFQVPFERARNFALLFVCA